MKFKTGDKVRLNRDFGGYYQEDYDTPIPGFGDEVVISNRIDEELERYWFTLYGNEWCLTEFEAELIEMAKPQIDKTVTDLQAQLDAAHATRDSLLARIAALEGVISSAFMELYKDADLDRTAMRVNVSNLFVTAGFRLEFPDYDCMKVVIERNIEPAEATDTSK